MFEFDAVLSTAIAVNGKSGAAEKPAASTLARAKGPLSAELLDKMQRYWCAANYLVVGQIYLQENPLLREPLSKRAHQAAPARPLGHLGRAEFHLRSSEPADPRNGREHDLHFRAPATAGRP